MKSFKLLFTLIFLFPVFVHAQAPSNAPVKMASFKAIDKDNNGKVTKEEAKAAGVSDADFKKADKNNDGTIDAKEWALIFPGGA
jgi:EF hand